MTLFGAVGAFFAPITPFLITILILLGIDLVFGLVSAIKRNEPITSRKLGHTLSKFIMYTGSLIIAMIFGQYVPDVNLVKIIGMFISFNELKSCDEHLKVVMGFSVHDMIIKLIKRDGENKAKSK
jgi:hypothetical protein